jgi:hypothetical protein
MHPSCLPVTSSEQSDHSLASIIQPPIWSRTFSIFLIKLHIPQPLSSSSSSSLTCFIFDPTTSPFPHQGPIILHYQLIQSITHDVVHQTPPFDHRRLDVSRSCLCGDLARSGHLQRSTMRLQQGHFQSTRQKHCLDNILMVW